MSIVNMTFRQSDTHSQFTIDHSLFRSQTLHRVRHRRSYCLETYCSKSNNNGDNSTNKKYPPAYVYSIDIILQPAMHVIPRNGRSNYKCNADKNDELF